MCDLVAVFRDTVHLRYEPHVFDPVSLERPLSPVHSSCQCLIWRLWICVPSLVSFWLKETFCWAQKGKAKPSTGECQWSQASGKQAYFLLQKYPWATGINMQENCTRGGKVKLHSVLLSYRASQTPGMLQRVVAEAFLGRNHLFDYLVKNAIWSCSQWLWKCLGALKFASDLH
jgi:hypothetical protein